MTNKEINITDFIDNTPLSSLPSCEYLDHYIFIDPLSGFSIFYPSTAFGGILSGGVTYTDETSGGPLQDICAQDFCTKTINIPPIRIFCITNFIVSLTGLDESTTKIIKIIYDFNDGPVEEVIFKPGGPAPKTLPFNHIFYPQNRFCTQFTPSITVIKDDCCTTTYNFTLCAFQCGILDMYEKTYLLNAQQTLTPYNVLLTLEQAVDRQLFNHLLLTNEPFFATAQDPGLPNLVDPVPPVKNVPLFELSTEFIPATTQPVYPNPVVAPPPQYTYIQGPGIDLVPDSVTLLYNQLLTNEDSTLILSGINLPYFSQVGILITA